MRTLFTLAILAISLTNTQAYCQDRANTKNIRVGDWEFTIETSYHSVDYAGVSKDPFDRVFYIDTNGQQKELTLGGYMWGHARVILSMELNGNELAVNHTNRVAGSAVRAIFILHEGTWKRLTS
jgi:hypothetical protein